jgi:hypothetical protein
MKRNREPDKRNEILTISTDSEDDDKPLAQLVSKEEMRHANAWTYDIKVKPRKTRPVSFANAYFQSKLVSETQKQAFVKKCSDMIKEPVTKKQYNSRITALFENRIRQEVDATPGLEDELDTVRADHALKNKMSPPKKWADSQNSKTGAAGAADKKKKRKCDSQESHQPQSPQRTHEYDEQKKIKTETAIKFFKTQEWFKKGSDSRKMQKRQLRMPERHEDPATDLKQLLAMKFGFVQTDTGKGYKIVNLN